MVEGLAGRRVVVTRAAEQADALADLLRVAGAVPVVVPLVETIRNAVAMDELASLTASEFEWLVVTSPNGARCCLDALDGRFPTRIAAVGAGSASVLAAAGVVVDLVPNRQRAKGLLDDLPRPALHADGSRPRILLVQAFDAEAVMADGLLERGWDVHAVSPYRTVAARPGAGVQLAALSADAVLFAAGSAARAWVEVFGDSSPPVVIAIGPQTAAATEAAGLKVTAVAADHSLEGLVGALVVYFAPRQ